MKQENRVFLDISTCTAKEHFALCALFLYFLCYLFWTFSPWKILLSSQNKDPTMLGKYKLIGKAL